MYGLFQVCIACMIWVEPRPTGRGSELQVARLDMFARTYWLGGGSRLPMGVCRHTLGPGCHNLQCGSRLSIGRDLTH